MTIDVGAFSVTIPSGSFHGTRSGPFTFQGVINGTSLRIDMVPTGTNRYGFQAQAADASLTGTVNPVSVTLTIGGDSGTASITATING